jgi:hypothetical protein
MSRLSMIHYPRYFPPFSKRVCEPWTPGSTGSPAPLFVQNSVLENLQTSSTPLQTRKRSPFGCSPVYNVNLLSRICTVFLNCSTKVLSEKCTNPLFRQYVWKGLFPSVFIIETFMRFNDMNIAEPDNWGAHDNIEFSFLHDLIRLH